jgi:alginate O-acetyltransferase complex protein AlgI
MILLLAFVREKWRSIALLSLSLLFYYYGTGLHVLTMLGMAGANYYGAAFIRAHDDGKQRKRVLILLISLNLAILAFFKYSGFIIENLNIILLLLGQSPIVYEKKVLIPLGISFITFHNVSLIVDVYRKSVPDKPGLMQTLNYIFAFPKIIAGPVLRFGEYIKTGWVCEIGPESFVRGMRIFIIGLAKKSIIANTLGGTADMVFSIPSDSLTVLMSWCGIFAYTMQLYFDFSGYSDMAVGIAKVVGLNCRKFQLPVYRVVNP